MRAMTLLALAVLIGALLIIAAVLAHAQARYTLAIGRFGGTDQEIQECYFAIGQAASLTLHPQGEPCRIARELIGRTGTLVFVAD